MQLQEPTTLTRPLRVIDLGMIPYAECWDLQNNLAASIGRGEGAETLLLLEHPHTYTCGRRGGRDHILIDDEELARRGVAVLDVDRGGDVTYHGPGQLVAYPIIDLSRAGAAIDYPGYVRKLEHVLIDTLADFNITAHQLPGFSGVWRLRDGEEVKIAAIGVKVDGRAVTTHGIALNVTTDPQYFSWIVPCGITDKGVTSIAQALTAPPSMERVKESFTHHFCRIFAFDPPPPIDAR
jgi:lipoate-protein ligase B